MGVLDLRLSPNVNTVSRYLDQFARAVYGFAFPLVKKCSLSPFNLSSAATAAAAAARTQLCRFSACKETACSPSPIPEPITTPSGRDPLEGWKPVTMMIYPIGKMNLPSSDDEY